MQGVIRHLLEVDALEVLVLVDNVTDSLSTVPRDVRNETAVLRRAGSLPIARSTGFPSSSPRASAATGRRSSSTQARKPTQSLATARC